MARRHLSLSRLVSLSLLGASVVGCAEDNRPPRLEAVDDQVAAVGSELVVTLRGTDPDGDDLVYGFAGELDDLDDRATIAERPDGTAVFRFTPLGADVGTWPLDFTVTDGSATDTVTARLEVRTALDGTAPVFREPLGSGTTLDLGVTACLDLAIVIEDQDDAAVTIAAVPPLIDDSTLTQDTGLSAQWQWCPNKDQLGEDRFPLTLSADDGENPPVLKNYLIVLRPGDNPQCPGKGPTIAHEPEDLSTVLDLQLSAEVSDDLGLKGPPIVYYTLEEPKLPLDFSELDIAQMELQSGDDLLGIWTATVPNPVAGMAEGATADLYYLISAVDDDDAEGECDHLTDLPDEGVFAIEVRNPGGSGGAGVCESCSADVQCGGSDDLCVAVGDDTVCLEACGGCEDGFACTAVTSVDGTTAEQCVPARCVDEPPPPCEDDALEENDTRAQAGLQDPLDPGVVEDLVACEGDEDWFQLSITDAGTLGGLITAGRGDADLSLGLYDISGTELQVADEPGSDEVVGACVSPGTYYLRVFSTAGGTRAYDLLVDFSAENCAGTCEDDAAEDDDTFDTASAVTLPFNASGRAICSEDADFFAVDLSTGDTLVQDLTFVHADGDLDLHFHDVDGADLTPCTPDAPELCSLDAGQSATSNEHAERTITQAGCDPCTFFVSVQGYGGAANDYDISLAVE
ncbi:MAG: hypothetical protein AAGA54_30155 [Myxococcota bacterium]